MSARELSNPNSPRALLGSGWSDGNPWDALEPVLQSGCSADVLDAPFGGRYTNGCNRVR
jgi:hypothetical protein